MSMYHPQINSVQIKIVGLLGDFSKKEATDYQKKLISNGFYLDDHPITNEQNDSRKKEELESALKDLFYPDFRNIMFLKSKSADKKLLSRRYINDKPQSAVLLKKNFNDSSQIEFPIKVNKTEVFLFPNQIGLFALTIEIDKPEKSLEDVNNVIFMSRQFETNLNNGLKWHDWISKQLICGIELRSKDNKVVKADEYSGSKFKVFCVIDCEEKENRAALLFDMASASKLETGKGIGDYAPSIEYLEDVSKNKISIFKNWEGLCMFDSFTCIGKDILREDWQKATWEYTYFRIYLFRLFFKYNIYRYNSELYDKPVKLRSQFEGFLNDYNLSHISFNFLPNEIFDKMGKALKLDEEMVAFESRINKLSATIQEQKQSRTNMLLQAVTALGAISSIQPVVIGLNYAKSYLKLSNLSFYSLLSTIVLGIGFFVINFIMPEKIKDVKKIIFKWFK
jgi:hypothetical protein